MTSPAQALQRLRDAAGSGALEEFCHRYGVRVRTVFGSAGRGEESARDLAVGVLVEHDVDFDLLGAITDLIDLAGTDAVDLAHLNRGGAVIRERTLVGSVALYESVPGALADAQVAAIAERVETDPMRRLDLELLAGESAGTRLALGSGKGARDQAVARRPRRTRPLRRVRLLNGEYVRQVARWVVARADGTEPAG